MNQITVYECEYCGAIRRSKHNMKKHEANCFWRLENRTCATCIFPYVDKLNDSEIKRCEGGHLNARDKWNVHCIYHQQSDDLYPKARIGNVEMKGKMSQEFRMRYPDSHLYDE